MLDQLKGFALDKIKEQFAPNSLNEEQTQQASEEGTNAFMSMIQEQLSGGKLDVVQGLFSNGAQSDNPLVGGLKDKLVGILQNKGLNAQEAQQNAESAVPGIINSLKDRFQSPSEEDKDFDLGSLTQLIPGDAGDMINKIGGFFGK